MRIYNINRADSPCYKRNISSNQNLYQVLKHNSISFNAVNIDQSSVIDKTFQSLVFNSFNAFSQIANKAYLKLAEAHYITDIDGYSAISADGLFPKDIIGSVVKAAKDGTRIKISKGNDSKYSYDNELNIKISPVDETCSYAIRLLCPDSVSYNGYEINLDSFAQAIKLQNLHSQNQSRNITETQLIKFIELAKKYLPEFIGDKYGWAPVKI